VQLYVKTVNIWSNLHLHFNEFMFWNSRSTNSNFSRLHHILNNDIRYWYNLIKGCMLRLTSKMQCVFCDRLSCLHSQTPHLWMKITLRCSYQFCNGVDLIVDSSFIFDCHPSVCSVPKLAYCDDRVQCIFSDSRRCASILLSCVDLQLFLLIFIVLICKWILGVFLVCYLWSMFFVFM